MKGLNLFTGTKAALRMIFGCLLFCLLLGGCKKRESGLVLELGQTSGSMGSRDGVGTSGGMGSRDGIETSGGMGSRDGIGTSGGMDKREDAGIPPIGGTFSTDSGESRVLIYVYVCGAVCDPGVVVLPAGSRADDAVKAAGGMTQDADRAYVNLAAVVSDGEKVFIPTLEEAKTFYREQVANEAGLININKADLTRLCTLPGIGESRAADIIAYREKNGLFRAIEDIMKVPGIKTSTFSKISDMITVE